MTGAESAIRVVVVDDHPLFRQGIGALIRDSPGTALAGAGASGEEAVALCAQLRPDVVVMDVHMPGMGGVEAIRQILRAQPAVAILMLTMMDEDDSVFAAMRAGARGYVLKGAQPAEILRAVVAVASGQAIFGSNVAERLTGYFADAGATSAVQPFSQLTTREREILEMMSAGAGNAAIAARLGLSEKTIRNNVSNVFVKLRVSDRAAAVARARDAGIRPHPLFSRMGGEDDDVQPDHLYLASPEVKGNPADLDQDEPDSCREGKGGLSVVAGHVLNNHHTAERS